VSDARKALALFEALLPDMVRVLGPDNPVTLATRGNLARWTGEVGNAGMALALFESLLPDMTQVLGPDRPDTLTTRSNVARWTGKVGDNPQGPGAVRGPAARPDSGAGPRPPRHPRHAGGDRIAEGQLKSDAIWLR
jgi:hypothetical protein